MFNISYFILFQEKINAFYLGRTVYILTKKGGPAATVSIHIECSFRLDTNWSACIKLINTRRITKPTSRLLFNISINRTN